MAIYLRKLLGFVIQKSWAFFICNLTFEILKYIYIYKHILHYQFLFKKKEKKIIFLFALMHPTTLACGEVQHTLYDQQQHSPGSFNKTLCF